jgi:hypothetical protein
VGGNGHPAGRGYDLVTGRGSPYANRVIPDLLRLTVGMGHAPLRHGLSAGTALSINLRADPHGVALALAQAVAMGADLAESPPVGGLLLPVPVRTLRDQGDVQTGEAVPALPVPAQLAVSPRRLGHSARGTLPRAEDAGPELLDEPVRLLDGDPAGALPPTTAEAIANAERFEGLSPDMDGE